MEYLLQVSHLRKHFGNVKAVNGISFGIQPGICFGLLGPNGAGKTTTIEMIEGIVEPSDGEILYKGKIRNKLFSKETGIQFQATALQDFLTVEEVIAMFASFYPHPSSLQQLVDLCELDEFVDREANKLSGGQKQRLLLALALINDPELIFLDEPTTGLDPQSRRKFWDIVNSIKARGKTVVLTTHYMDEAEILCDELVIMDHGEIIDQGSPRELLEKHLPHKQVCIENTVPSFDDQQLSGEVNHNNNDLEITTNSIETTLQELISLKFDMSSLRVRNPTLEDLFIKLTGRHLRE